MHRKKKKGEKKRKKNEIFFFIQKTEVFQNAISVLMYIGG